MLRVMIVDDGADSQRPSHRLRPMAEQAGYQLVADGPEPRRLLEAVKAGQPDVILIHSGSPSRDALEAIAQLSESAPRPIVMFASDRRPEVIRKAVEAGVSAYIVDGLAAERLPPIIEAARARFEAFQAMKAELDAVKAKLSERKLVERAKGLLMKTRSIDEDAAYASLRKMAMERSLSIGEVSRQFLAVSELLG